MAAAPSAMTKPSRFLENGLAAACGGAFAVDSADNSEKRIRHSALTEPSVPMQSACSTSARWIGWTGGWIGLGRDGQGDENGVGEQSVTERSARWSAVAGRGRRTGLS